MHGASVLPSPGSGAAALKNYVQGRLFLHAASVLLPRGQILPSFPGVTHLYPKPENTYTSTVSSIYTVPEEADTADNLIEFSRESVGELQGHPATRDLEGILPSRPPGPKGPRARTNRAEWPFGNPGDQKKAKRKCFARYVEKPIFLNNSAAVSHS